MPTSLRRSLLVGCFLLILTREARAGFDYEIGFDQSGIWARHDQLALEYGVIAVEAAGSLWFGNDTPIGHTFWQTVDASVISGIAADILKYATSRARPVQGNDPNAWFKGSGHESFPSGEVTLQASFVTPFIVDYAKEQWEDGRSAWREFLRRTGIGP